jgi:hypothetical protein
VILLLETIFVPVPVEGSPVKAGQIDLPPVPFVVLQRVVELNRKIHQPEEINNHK